MSEYFDWSAEHTQADPADKEQRVEQLDCGIRALAWLKVVDDLGIEAARTI